MTHHKEVHITNSAQELMFQLGTQIALGKNFDKTLESIKRHVEKDHMLGISGIIFNDEVTRHLAAVIRIPSKYTQDDSRLPQILGLPPLVYDKGLPPSDK